MRFRAAFAGRESSVWMQEREVSMEILSLTGIRKLSHDFIQEGVYPRAADGRTTAPVTK